jgi:lysophospholipase
LNLDEAAYIRSKAVNSGPAWDEYLTNVGLADFDVASFVARAPQGDMPNVAFTISGGGQRAMLVGGSVLAGMDNRNTSAVAAKTGGVVQLANYVVGLSGGSWITGSWAMTGYPQLQRASRSLIPFSLLRRRLLTLNANADANRIKR